jgi:hypothetical protein
MSAKHEQLRELAGGITLLIALCTSFVCAAETPAVKYDQRRWWSPGDGGVFAPVMDFKNELGTIRTLNVGGPTETRGHPFFTPLGSNGRACVTCHQPSDGMSLASATIQQRWRDTQGEDPLFAAIDGSNCPHLPQEQASSHSLLLDRGLFRVFRPWPPKREDGSTIDPQFTIEVIRDPTGCNRHPQYGLKSKAAHVSVYRRPRPVTNAKYLTSTGFSFEPKNGLPLRRDPETGLLLSGNLMADSRVPTLKAQAIDAVATHLQGPAPSAATLQAITTFENQLYTAQAKDRFGGALTEGGAGGGPETLRESLEGDLQYGGSPHLERIFTVEAKCRHQRWAHGGRDGGAARIPRIRGAWC